MGKYKVMVLLVIFLSGYNLVFSQEGRDMADIRDQYFKALYDEDVALELLDHFSANEKDDAVWKAYHGGIHAVMCLHTGNPFKRGKLIKEAQILIEQAVVDSPSNTEIRFMRFAVESQLPKFLGKSKNLVEDASFLGKKLLEDDISHLSLDARLYIVKILKDYGKIEKEQLLLIEERMLSS